MATASDKIPESVQEQKSEVVHMESITRVMNLPIVKRAAAIVVTLYTKIKDNNSVTKRTLTSAEVIVKTAVSTATPVVANFQGPMEKIDNVLCSGLDYVEKKIPAITKDSLEMSYLWKYTSETRAVKALLGIFKVTMHSEVQKEFAISLNLENQQVSQLNPYIVAFKAYQQNLSIAEFITRVSKIYLSELLKEVKEGNKDSIEETTKDEPLRTTQEPQPEETSQPKTEETMKETVEAN